MSLLTAAACHAEGQGMLMAKIDRSEFISFVRLNSDDPASMK
jgi:hypothetical protein